jgi:anti-sigma factor RsiW
MPAIAHGLARWSPVDESHLAECADCAAEWTIVRAAAASGRSAARSLDSARIADRVLESLRKPAPPRVASRLRRWAVPVALAAVLTLVFVRRRAPEAPDPQTATVTLSLLPEAEVLSDAELESVIRLIPVADPADPGATDSLSDEELTTMLQDLEG